MTQLRRLKHVADVRFSSVDKKTVDGQIDVKLCNYTDVYYSERILADMPFMDATATPDQVATFTLKGGDVLLTKDSETADDIGVSAYVPQDLPGVLCGYHLALARPRPSAIDGRYLRWALVSAGSRQQLELAATGVTRFGLRQDAVGGLTVPIPPLHEQVSIADYLDTETARIDIALDLRRRTITLLDEKTIAVLDAAFASASTRRTKLKHLLAQSPCYGVLVPNFVDAGVPFVRVGDLTSMGSEDAPARYLSESQSNEYARTRLAFGDILLSVVGSIDKVRLVSSALVGSNIARAVCRLVPMAGVPSDLLALWFRTTAYLHQARQATSSDTAQPTLGMGDLADFEVWFPEPNAYDECRTRLQQKLDSLAAARNSLQRQVDLVVERRQALITAAVTGQLATSGVAA